MAPKINERNIMRYKITKKMEKMILDILVLKQLLENDKISNREELEKQYNELIANLLIYFSIQNKKNKSY